MKVVGLPYSQFVSLVKQVDPAMVWKAPHHADDHAGQGLIGSDTVYQGYLAYPGMVVLHPSTPEASCLSEAGHVTCPNAYHTHMAMHAPPLPKAPPKWLHKPCVHAQLEVARLALNAGASAVYLYKHKLSKHGWAYIASKVKAKAAAQGEKCTHVLGGVPTGTLPAPVPHVAASPSTVHPPTPTPKSKVVLAGTPLEGPCLHKGEWDASKVGGGVPTRDTLTAVTSLYLLHEVALAVADARDTLLDSVSVDPWTVAAFAHTTPTQAPTQGPAVDAARWAALRATLPTEPATFEQWQAGRRVVFMEHLDTLVHRYTLALARNMFDYLTMACAGESRHCPGGKWTDGDPKGRHEAWKRALDYDPRSMLPTLVRVFLEVKWGGAYGGPKWAFIAHEAQRYWSLSPLAFVDHCNSLQHNGGLAFNKGYVLSMPPVSSYLHMLNTKHNGSLLAGGTWQVSQWAHPAAPSHTVAWAVDTAVALGLVPTPGATLTPTSDPYVPGYTWGTLPFTLTLEATYVKATPSTLPTLAQVTGTGAHSSGGHHIYSTTLATPWDSDPGHRRQSGAAHAALCHTVCHCETA